METYISEERKKELQYWWHRIQKLHEGGNLNTKYIQDSTDIGSYKAIYGQFGSLKNMEQSIEMGCDWEEARNREKEKHTIDYHKVENILQEMLDNNELTLENIKNHSELPDYVTILNEFGGIKEMRNESLDFGRNICTDCMYEIDNCNKTPEICEQEYKEIMGGNYERD